MILNDLIIENDRLIVKVSNKGAEIQSIFDKNHTFEWIWNGDQKYWPRHAPVLFPIVGRLKNNQYLYQGEIFNIPQHGFARDLDFEVILHNQDAICLQLTSSLLTKTYYPFNFKLEINYQLIDDGIQTKYTVYNQGNIPMYYNLGIHPGFNIPFQLNEKISDYYIMFEKEETIIRHLLEDGLFNGQTENLGKHQTIDLNYSLFEKDAIVLKKLDSNFLYITNKQKSLQLKVEFQGWPYLGIWTKPNAPFICIEPWLGYADSIEHNYLIEEKEAIQVLQPYTNEVFEIKFLMT